MKINFEIGQKIKHRVDIIWSIFGSEIYKVDDKEILRKRSLKPRGSRKFTVKDEENTYDVEIKIDMAPKVKSWLFPGDWVAQVYVNGELFISDLTPSFRKKVKKINHITNIILIIFLSLLIIIWVIIWVIKSLK
jgi:hypothetical protein